MNRKFIEKKTDKHEKKNLNFICSSWELEIKQWDSTLHHDMGKNWETDNFTLES